MSSKKYSCNHCEYSSDRQFNLKRHSKAKHTQTTNDNKKDITTKRAKKLIVLNEIIDDSTESEDKPLNEEVKEIIEHEEESIFIEEQPSTEPQKTTYNDIKHNKLPEAPKEPKKYSKSGPVTAPRRLTINRVTTRNIGFGMVGAGIFAGMM